MRGACRAGVAGLCRTRRGAAGQGGRLSDRHTAPTGSIDESVRVGSFSHLDQLLPHYTLNKAATPLPLPAAAAEPKIDYRFENQSLDARRFPRAPARHRIAADQGRRSPVRALPIRSQRPSNRFVSHSMAKSIVSLAIGMALAEKKIASLDDTVAKYVPELGRQSLWRDHDTQYAAHVVRRAVQRSL